MANWAYTCYAVEGPKEVLQKIEQAILHHPVSEGSDEMWEGDILSALGIKWENKEPDGSGYYMRGFIREEPWWDKDDTVLRFDAEEAWGATDFHEVLDKNLPTKTYYVVEEGGEEIYATNDKEGKYFPDRYYVDTCIDDNYQSDYFTTEEAVYRWLSKISDGRIKTQEDVTAFNEDVQNEDDFISIHEFKVID